MGSSPTSGTNRIGDLVLCGELVSTAGGARLALFLPRRASEVDLACHLVAFEHAPGLVPGELQRQGVGHRGAE